MISVCLILFLIAFFIVCSIIIIYIIWFPIINNKKELTAESDLDFRLRTLLILLSIGAGLFTFYQYRVHINETNYSKAVLEYVEKTIDPVYEKFSAYHASVIINTNKLYYTSVDDDTHDERNQLYNETVIAAQELTQVQQKLHVFDPIILLGLSKTKSVLDDLIRFAAFNPKYREQIDQRKNAADKKGRFMLCKLLDISELIKEDVSSYDYPNLIKIKQDKRFKKVVQDIEYYLKYLACKEKDQEDCNDQKFDEFISKNSDWTIDTTDNN